MGRTPVKPLIKAHKREEAMKLSELKEKEKGRIKAIRGERGLKKRLQDMGIVAGEIVEVVKIAPLGDPIDICVKGYSLSLRKSEAENIEVEVIG